tara:strand:+ start:1201 stop:1533 length:333 start_codon:yes stop_codon:yes gene_type:complete
MDYIKPFLIGGAVIAGSKFVADNGPPQLAPLIGGMPTGIVASYFLANDDNRRKYFDGYVYSSFTLFIAILAIYILDNKTSIHVNIISGIALVLWAIITYFVINKFVKSKK